MFSDPVVQPPIYIFPFPAGPSGTPAPTPSVAQRLSLLMHHPRFWCPLSHPIRAWCLRPRHVRPRHLLSRPGSLSPRHTRLRYLLLHPPPSWCPAAPCAAPPPHAHYAELVQVPPQSGGFSGFYPGGARGLCASSTLCLRASFDGSSFTTVTRAVSVASTCAHTASASAAATAASTTPLSGGADCVPPAGPPSGSLSHPSRGDSAGGRGSSTHGSLRHRRRSVRLW
jgi:hypothetical protein